MITIGVIGDFGIKSENSLAISSLVQSWNPTVIVTTGDNIYSPPTHKNYSSIIGSLYKEYLPPPPQLIPPKAQNPLLLLHHSDRKSTPKKFTSRFLSCVGNHDYPFSSYTDYFGLPTYYSVEFVEPPNFLKILSLNNYNDEGGKFNATASEQRTWLEKELSCSSQFQWILVTFHYPQVCSNSSDQENELSLKRSFPFHHYPNVVLIMSGHHHIYERLELNGIMNLVVGTSGHSVRRRSQFVVKQSKCLDDSGFGAVKLEFNGWNQIKGSYHVVNRSKRGKGSGQQDIKSVVKDEFVINKY